MTDSLIYMMLAMAFMSFGFYGVSINYPYDGSQLILGLSAMISGFTVMRGLK